jgi:hypothetical protein
LWIFLVRNRIRSVTVVFPASMCAMIPMLRWMARRLPVGELTAGICVSTVETMAGEI